ncbi:MAG: FhaA domain-containing protein [Limnochordia bacterium]
MSILAKLEKTLEGLVEGVFRRGFRGSVQPVEIGQAPGPGNGREPPGQHLPNLCAQCLPGLCLHPADKENLDALASTLRSELADHLQQAAKRGSYFFVRPPQIAFLADENLDQGSIVIHSSFCEEEDSGTGPMTTRKGWAPCRK